MQKIFYLCCCWFAANTLFAQTGIQGKVTDTKGEIVIGAIVSATSVAKSGAKSAVTVEDDGSYQLIMPVGMYSIQVSSMGFQTQKLTNVQVEKDKWTRKDFVLKYSDTPVVAIEAMATTAPTAKKSVARSPATVKSDKSRSVVAESTKKAAPSRERIAKRIAAPAMSPMPPASSVHRDAIAYEPTYGVVESKTTTKDVSLDKRAVGARAEMASTIPLALKREDDATKSVIEAADKEETSKNDATMDVLRKSKPTFLETATAAEKAKVDADIADESLPDAPEEKAGQLTAGEWSDLKNWNFWLRSIDTAFSTYHKNWKYNFEDRYSVNVVGAENQPIADAQVRLLATDGTLVWEARTNNHGNAELWSGLFGLKYNNLIFKVFHDGKIFDFKNAKTFKTSVNTLKINASCSGLTGLDIAFVVDATGSMGDEIAYLKSEMADVIRRVKMNNQSLNIRTASVFYRDFTDEYVTKIFPFGKSLKQNLAFMRNQFAGGGGDFEEAVPEGLEAGIDSLQWSEKALARILFLVLDAPPHLEPQNIEKLHRLTQKAAAKGIRIIPITASGIDKNVEYLMKTLGVTTGGTYVFLTDDSGIGGTHIKATTEKHDVEHLNDLMVRLIQEATDTETCRRLAEKASTGGDAILDASFKLSPTPASSILYIDMKKDIESLRITNVHGQVMEDLYDLKTGTKEIAVNTWASGVYYATIKQGNSVSTKKFSVIR